MWFKERFTALLPGARLLYLRHHSLMLSLCAVMSGKNTQIKQIKRSVFLFPPFTDLKTIKHCLTLTPQLVREAVNPHYLVTTCFAPSVLP